jgi:hypothetical protein
MYALKTSQTCQSSTGIEQHSQLGMPLIGGLYYAAGVPRVMGGLYANCD